MKRRDFVKASLGLPAAGLATVPAAVGQGLEPASRPRPGILADASLPMELPKSHRNFDECEVRGALVDPSGGSIEGFSLEQSIPLLETGRQELRWRDGQVSRLEGKPVRLRLAMRAAALYSLQFVS